MIKIGLCDDTYLYIEQLSKILNDISISKKIDTEITTFNSGKDLVNFCELHKNYFDILFLDVLMDEINGIDTAKLIRKLSSNVYILFVTVSKEYALDSYSVNAYSYILKPFAYDSIESKFLELCNKVHLDKKNIIYVKSKQDIYTINLNKVVYFESNLRKITANMNNKDTLTFYNKMSSLEENINSSVFIRCHRSFLVNLAYIKNIIGSELVTIDNKTLPISKKYLNSTKEAFTNYIKAMILY